MAKLDEHPLRLGDEIHRSKHAQTMRGSWNGYDVVAKRVRLDLEPAEQARAARCIRRESAVIARLRHGSIVRAIACLDDPATLVLSLVEGRTMREELRVRRTLPAREACIVGVQLADALAHVHVRGWLHRDVKPANVMYDGARATLIDFHLAKRQGDMRGGAGTRLFAAPEQVRGGEVSAAADVWGLGTVLYRATTGRLPFHAESGHPQLTERAVPVLQRTSRELPRALATLIDSMLDPAPGRRPEASAITAELRYLARVVDVAA